MLEFYFIVSWIAVFVLIHWDVTTGEEETNEVLFDEREDDR